MKRNSGRGRISSNRFRSIVTPERAASCRRFSASPRRLVGAALTILCTTLCLAAGTPADPGALLSEADRIKTTDHARFVAILDSLRAGSGRLSQAERDYFRYLQAWKAVLEGENQTVVAELEDIIRHAVDETLQFRARSTLMNLEELTGHYESAYSELNRLLEQLPRITDRNAREQAMLCAAQLYRAVGQTDLGVSFAQRVMDENGSGRGVCRGGQQRLAALFEAGRLRSVGAEVGAIIDECEKLGEGLYSNEIRTHAARLYIDQGRLDDAIALLRTHYEDARRTQYYRIVSQFEALLAEAYLRKGLVAPAQSFAASSLEHAVKSPYAESSVIANRVLYQLAKDRGDFKTALEFHQQYAIADRGYLDDVSARQLAYDKVVHESLANQLKIAALTRENEVLRLEKSLGAEALENSRLYAVLLLTVLLFIGLWTYRTKRSQLHFMNLSRLDGLTGISNRHHFIDQAQSALEQAKAAGRELCVLLCDLDHFKAINDRHGHATGDFVLQETVSRCRVHLRPHEPFGRFGGEEFGIVLPGCGPQDGRARAEQLREAIAAISGRFGTGEAQVSASFGLAVTSGSGYELRQLLAHADAALYQAKAAGRNRVVIYDAGMAVTRSDELLARRVATVGSS